MPFTQEQDAFILKAHFGSAVRNEDGTWSYSFRSCREQFMEEYPDVIISYKAFANHKTRIVDRFENKNCICKEKHTGRPLLRNDEVVQDVRQRMEASPKKSIRQLSAQAGVSYSTYS
uniref:DUF4817 domain-containing protein n=1 Tax=Photinus pyralis TaxID=7054 RepID=A0A1Y1K0G4_PHOPY